MLAISHARSIQPKAGKEKKLELEYESRKVPSECIEDIVRVCSCPLSTAFVLNSYQHVFAGFGNPIEQVVAYAAIYLGF